MKLGIYLSSKEISIAEFARLLNVSRVTVNDYVRGRKKPSEENMVAIFNLSGGLVTPNDFYEIPALQVKSPSHSESHSSVKSS